MSGKKLNWSRVQKEQLVRRHGWEPIGDLGPYPASLKAGGMRTRRKRKAKRHKHQSVLKPRYLRAARPSRDFSWGEYEIRVTKQGVNVLRENVSVPRAEAERVLSRIPKTFKPQVRFVEYGGDASHGGFPGQRKP